MRLVADYSGQTLGRYHILRKIDRGGMSVVYRGNDTENQRTVAVKILVSFLLDEPQFRSRFDREIQLLQKLDHPDIVPSWNMASKRARPASSCRF